MQPGARRVLIAVACALLAGCDWSTPYAAVPPADPALAAAISRSRDAHKDAWNRNVIILGFDSCDPDLLDDLIRQGKLPNFARLRREGASGLLESLQPLLSPIVWTTIATGMAPERHGILDFMTRVGNRAVPVSSRMRTADTMWELLARQGEQVGVVGWLVTYPADPLRNAFVVTERMGLLAFEYAKEEATDAPQRTWPAELAKEIEKRDRVTIDDLPLAKVRPFADVTGDEYKNAYSPAFSQENRLGNLRLTLATAETFRAAGERLYAEKRPRFFAAYFEAMDALSHIFMRYAPPKLREVAEPEYMKYRSAMEANYMWHDRVLGEYMDLADEKTTLFVVSDHGFKSGDFRRADSSDFHAKTGAMWHRPYGVFFAWGNGVAKGARVTGATVFDIAPTVLASMGYPKPADMPGKVLESAFVGGLPHETVPTYYGDARKLTVAGFGADARANASSDTSAQEDASPEDQATVERLKALGYMGGDRSDPASSQLNLGIRYASTGRFQDAIDEFTKVWEKQPTAGVATSLAGVYLNMGKLDLAQKWADEALKLDPTDLIAKLFVARIHIKSGRLNEAEALLTAEIKNAPELPFLHLAVAALHEARLDAAKKRKDDAAAARERTLVIASYREALRREPDDPTSRAALAGILLEQTSATAIVDPAETEEALTNYDAALALRPNMALWHNNRSIALLRLGSLARRDGRSDEVETRGKDAVAATDRALEIWRKRTGKEYAKAWANRAYALCLLLDRFDDAYQSAMKAREAEPAYVFKWEAFVNALAKAGKPLPPPAPAAPQAPVPPGDGPNPSDSQKRPNDVR